MEIKLKQRTKEWLEYRKNHITATQIAAITGYDPFTNLEKLVHDKIFGPPPFTSNKYTEHGIQFEPVARQLFEKMTNLTFRDACFCDDHLKRFFASLDGYNDQHQIVLEIKCPYMNENHTLSSTWYTFFENGTVPLNYWAQVQCQLYCSGAQFSYFFVYLSHTQESKCVRVYQNQDFIQKMIIDSNKYLDLLKKAKQELEKTTILKSLSKFK